MIDTNHIFDHFTILLIHHIVKNNSNSASIVEIVILLSLEQNSELLRSHLQLLEAGRALQFLFLLFQMIEIDQFEYFTFYPELLSPVLFPELTCTYCFSTIHCTELFKIDITSKLAFVIII